MSYTTREIIKKICSFIKVDYLPQLLNFHKNEDWKFDWHKHLAEPIHSNHFGKGEIEISNHDKELIASIYNSTSQKIGYSIIGNTNITDFKTLPMFLFTYLRTTGEKLFFHIPFTIRIVLRNFSRKNIFK